MKHPFDAMLFQLVESIREESANDEDFKLLMDVVLHDLAMSAGALLVGLCDRPDRSCPMHKLGHFVASLTASVLATIQDADEEPEPEPAPAPAPKQAQLALVPITPAPSPTPETPPAPRFITPAEVFNLRKAKGLNQIQLGQLVGLSAGTISRWERGNPKFEPSVREYLTMQAALGWTG